MPKTVDLAKKILLSHKVKQFIDLNTDLGQSRDLAFFKKTNYELLNHVTSVSIPCAVHDGDPVELLEAIRQAKRFNCSVGAHIGYPDPARNGYESMQISPEALTAWIVVQLGAFQAMVRSEGLEIEHIRPHGALYTDFLSNPEVAMTVAKALHKMNAWFVLMGPAGPILEQVEKELGLRTAPEIYLGKRYDQQGKLSINRMQDFLPPQGVMDQARQLIGQSTLTAEDGKSVAVKFKTLHVSPLLPQCVDLADRVGQMLVQPVSLPLAEIGASGWL
ncbi:LamB/YcsF family protein [Vampirovibrio sp.]|uniref:LamB/YcsF family protein n=1 Tax=Vampirovibrio sp. TaxID=2717857 RepID=UPI0035937FF6